MPDAPDDPIAAALSVAIDVSFSHDGEVVSPPLHVRNVRRWRVAHEVAAFLRALPRSLSGHAYLIEPDEYAAAVERAAAGREGETDA